MSTERSGFLLIDKPAGITSHDVVGKVRRLYGTRRVGHTGTLDPMATGLLVILVGRAAKAAEYLTVKKKTYRAVLRLGMTTDTEDVTGQILKTSGDIPSKEQVISVAKTFEGEILQTPPMYSALKVGGQKLVDLARKGVEIERTPRPVTVYSLSCDPLENGDFALQVSCSAGTYIRTLCADIGKKLGCGGVMAALRRTETGEFSLEESITLEQLEAMEEEARFSKLMPIDALFADLAAVKLPAFYEKLCRSGCEIYQKKIGADHPLETRVRLCDAQGRFFALGEVREYDEGLAIKPLKQFDI
ncbi:MAG: tRNA pseudouridine(55) synthase TruB [Clostridia bacterium]|nr:tRNA pseudouridine(55) synthase TruB [Clostridia bacterium]